MQNRKLKAKVLVAGDHNVGKTCLMDCLVQGKSQEKEKSNLTNTIQEHTKTIKTRDGSLLKIDFTDLAGNAHN